MEPNASKPEKRVQAIKKLGSLGFKTAFRINPLFPMYPDGFMSKGIKHKLDVGLSYFTFDMVNELISVKPHCIIAGFLRVCNSIMHEEMREKAGIDLEKYYVLNTRYYSAEEIREYYTKIKGLCDQAGINFSVCYDADANFDTFRYLWANPEDCCCAKNMIPGFEKTARDAT
jgi:DNA repair photolyase